MASSQKDTKKSTKQNIAGKSFEKSFSTEALLQQAIAGLLTRMPDISGVQILQGTQELGKDLIFYIRGGFGESLLCACVVKNTKITGVAGSTGGARTVLIQSEQAFDSAYTDNFGKDLRVERVYVVTPYDLPPATVNSIKGKLQERAGQVVFIGGSILFDLFKKYWPDYFADEAEILERHLAETKNVYEAKSPLQGLATQYNLGDVSRYPRKIYVSQNLYRDINYYELGSALTISLPNLEDIEYFGHKEIQLIQDRLNDFRRTILFLSEWRFCEEREKQSIFNSCNSVISILLDVRKMNQAEESLEQELRIKRQDLKTAKKIKEAKREKKILLDIEVLSKQIEELKAEKSAKLALALEEMKALGRARANINSRVKEDLTSLRRTLFSKKLNGLEALSDPSYSQACFIDDCVCASPDGMFTFKTGVRLSFPRDILNKWNAHVLLVGAPGFGKTSFCRWHALQDAEDVTAGKSNIIPVYVPLHQFTQESLGSFEEAFLKNLGKSALIGDRHSSSKIRVRIYLDGLDEIASVERRREVVELAKSRSTDLNKYQIILTSRDYIYAEWLDWLPRITIGGFEDDDIKELVDRWLGNDSESNKRFNKQMGDLPALHQLMRTPLLATLIIMVFRQTGKLPENKTRLYENFIGLLSGGWDLAKGVLRKSGFGEIIKVQVLSSLAASLQERRRREFYAQDIKAAVKVTLSGKMLKDWETLKEEFIIDGLISKSGNVLQFSHHSFQEFLTAKNFMGSPQPTRANRALEAYLCGDDWWKEVIKFYIGLSANPSEISEWLANQIRHIRSISYINISKLQIQNLQSAMSEAFPEYAGEALNEIKHYAS